LNKNKLKPHFWVSYLFLAPLDKFLSIYLFR